MNPVKKMELLLKPTYEHTELPNNTFVCTCKVLGHTVCSDPQPNKTKAKQSAAEKMFEFCQFQFWIGTPQNITHHSVPENIDSDLQFQYPQTK